MDPYKSVYGINFDVATELIDGPEKFGQIIRKVTDRKCEFPINNLNQVSNAVVEAARENLVIGQA